MAVFLKSVVGLILATIIFYLVGGFIFAVWALLIFVVGPILVVFFVKWILGDFL